MKDIITSKGQNRGGLLNTRTNKVKDNGDLGKISSANIFFKKPLVTILKQEQKGKIILVLNCDF